MYDFQNVSGGETPGPPLQKPRGRIVPGPQQKKVATLILGPYRQP